MPSSEVVYKRALAIDPTHKGFGFAVVERNDRLVDWGTKETSAESRNRRCVRAAMVLIRAYEPDVLVLEDCTGLGSRRCLRVRLLIRLLRRTARNYGLPVESVAASLARRVCAQAERPTKRDAAVALTRRFPCLERYLPQPRRPWMTENPQTGIFDALALAVIALSTERNTTDGTKKNRGDP